MSSSKHGKSTKCTVEGNKKPEERRATAIAALVVEDAVDAGLCDKVTSIVRLETLVSKKQPALKDVVIQYLEDRGGKTISIRGRGSWD